MEKSLKILLVEDDRQACEELIRYAQTFDDIEMTGVTGNAAEAAQLVRTGMPDAVILDLELHEGSGNGLLFLKNLQENRPVKMPYILVTTNNSSHITHNAARQLGADFILTKYETGYSAHYVIDFLRMMQGIVSGTNPLSTASEAGTPTQTVSSYPGSSPAQTSFLYPGSSPASDAKQLRQAIHQELNQIGISPKAIGYQYLSDAIEIKINNLDENIFSILGPRYKKTDSSIERAMQNAINRAWRTSDPDDLLQFYTARIRSERGVPTIMEFIYYYATKIHTQYPSL